MTRAPRQPVTGEPAVSYVEHFQLRVLQDAYAEASAAYWLGRSDTFAAVGTPACDEISKACRNRALLGDVSTLELAEALESVAAGDAA